MYYPIPNRYPNCFKFNILEKKFCFFKFVPSRQSFGVCESNFAISNVADVIKGGENHLQILQFLLRLSKTQGSSFVSFPSVLLWWKSGLETKKWSLSQNILVRWTNTLCTVPPIAMFLISTVNINTIHRRVLLIYMLEIGVFQLAKIERTLFSSNLVHPCRRKLLTNIF